MIEPYLTVNTEDNATSIISSLLANLLANTIDGYPKVLSCSFNAVLLTWTALTKVSFIDSPVTSSINSLYPAFWTVPTKSYISSRLAAFKPNAKLSALTTSNIAS